MSSMDKESKNLLFTYENGSVLIKEHCDKIRYEIQMTQGEYNQEAYNGFLNEINVYEQECLENFEEANIFKAKIEQKLADSSELISRSSQFLNQFQLDEIQLKMYKNTVWIILTRLEDIKEKLLRSMFTDCLLKFKNSSLIRQNIELYFLENVKNMLEVDMSKMLYIYGKTFNLTSFKFDSFLLLYPLKRSLNLICINKYA